MALAAGVSLEGFKSLDWSTGKMMKLHPSIQKPFIYVRECYSLLYSDIKDLKELGFLFLHVSGDPGIGKSCFLWYVLVRLLNDADENGSAIIVELVNKETITTLEFAPDGTLSSIFSPAKSKYYSQPGTWLLTDQTYGSRAVMGTTVLFASPERENWEEARKTMDPSRFRSMLMPPFSLEELQAVFFFCSTHPRSPRNVRQFWVRYYLFGPVMRWYSIPIDTAFSELSEALTEMVHANLKVNDPSRLLDTADNNRIFIHWPTEDFSECAYISFISEWAARTFVMRCYSGYVDKYMKNIVILSSLETAVQQLVTLKGDPSPGLEVETEKVRKRARRVTREKQDLEMLQQKIRKTILKPFHQIPFAISGNPLTSVNYSAKLKNIFQLVRDRMVGDVDPEAVCFRELVAVNDIGDRPVDVFMRQGHGFVQYIEGDDNEFCVWIEADRVLEGAVYTTLVKLECTRGTFLDGGAHELKVFINEHVATDVVYDDFARLVISPAEARVVECLLDEDNYSAELLSPTKVLVTITSSRRDCKCFCLECKYDQVLL